MSHVLAARQTPPRLHSIFCPSGEHTPASWRLTLLFSALAFIDWKKCLWYEYKPVSRIWHSDHFNLVFSSRRCVQYYFEFASPQSGVLSPFPFNILIQCRLFLLPESKWITIINFVDHICIHSGSIAEIQFYKFSVSAPSCGFTMYLLREDWDLFFYQARTLPEFTG